MKTIFILFLGALAIVANSQNVNIKSQDNGLSFHNLFSSDQKPGVSCFRIPAIITAANGDLIVAIDERVPSCGDLKWNNDINIVTRRSKDNGNTWSDIEQIVNYPLGQSASDPSMILDKTTGAIFLFFNYMDLNKEKNVYYLKYTKSNDNGITWSTPIDISSQISKPEWHNDFKFITSGRGIQTTKGKLLHTMVNLESGLHIFGSDNHGESWYFIDKPITPANESKVIELANGTWMINSRVNASGIRHIHTSNDEGLNWVSRADSSLIDPGCNASILRYTSTNQGDDKNRLLFANAKSTNERTNMTLQVSYDESFSWTEGKTIYEGSSAYSSMTILTNGDIGLFFEKDNYTENVFVRVSLEWLTDERDVYFKTQKE